MLHQYKTAGMNIVLDTCSGSVHVVDDVAYDVIGLYRQHDEEEIIRILMDKYPEGVEDPLSPSGRSAITEVDIRECLHDVRTLEKEGKLFTPDTYEESAHVFRNEAAA